MFEPGELVTGHFTNELFRIIAEHSDYVNSQPHYIIYCYDVYDVFANMYKWGPANYKQELTPACD